GHRWDTETPSKDDLFKDYTDQINRQMKYQANLSADDILTPHMTALMREDPVAYRIAKDRLADYAGLQSNFSKWQNNVADKMLAPAIGTNSASKIVSATNTAMFDLTLGAGKLSFPVLNAMNFIQTVVPESAFILGKAVPADLAPKYSHFAAGGTKGPIGGIGVLDHLKLMGSSFKEMVNPSKELTSAIEQAVNDRVLQPRVVEDYVGASAA